jgi:hypothetical protein
MAWKIPRGRYSADPLAPKEIDGLQRAPETAADHEGKCSICRSAAREQRATLEPILRDLWHAALAHGHAVTLRPDLDSYDVLIEIHSDRAMDSDARIRHGRQDLSPTQIATGHAPTK